jgi:hypothetical protein
MIYMGAKYSTKTLIRQAVEMTKNSITERNAYKNIQYVYTICKITQEQELLLNILNVFGMFQVTSKPDLYPLVISYSDNGKGGTGGNYLMVQYFRNYIVRPVGKNKLLH